MQFLYRGIAAKSHVKSVNFNEPPRYSAFLVAIVRKRATSSCGHQGTVRAELGNKMGLISFTGVRSIRHSGFQQLLDPPPIK